MTETSGPDGRTDGEPLVAVVVNPSKRHAARALGLISDRVRAVYGVDPLVLPTTVDEPGAPQARRAVEAGVARIIVGGGDGTVREVAHGVADTGVSLGIVPLGTANILARNLQLTHRSPGEQVRVAVEGRDIRDVDLGVARVRRHGTRQPALPFLVMAGIGHDAAVVVDTDSGHKHHAGWIAYFVPAIRHAVRGAVSMHVELDGRDGEDLDAWSILAVNAPRIPGGFVIAPDAELDNGQLTIMDVTVTRPYQWLGIAAKGVLRVPADVPALRYRQARRLIVTPSTPQPVQLDGDVITDVERLRVDVLPQAVRVVVGMRR